MHAVILAAGQSERFTREGYKTPKPFLLVDWREQVQQMLWHVINSVPLNCYEISVAIPEGCSKLVNLDFGWHRSKVTLYEIPPTKGPADTARTILERMSTTHSTLFMDVDVINHTNDLQRLSTFTTCGVLVTESVNPLFSYVDALGSFTHIKEKERISKYAVSGAYFVHHMALKEFRELLVDTVNGYNEPYLSDVFDKLTCEKFSLHTTYEPVDWGTPRSLRYTGARIIKQTLEKESAEDVRI
jgi:NDP-sugar pyrophosphorylase family protein